MSDTPEVKAPFANPLPEKEEEVELQEGEELPPQPTLDEHVYAADPTRDPKVTHTAMSTEDLAEIGCDEDGNPLPGEPPPVEPEEGEDA